VAAEPVPQIMLFAQHLANLTCCIYCCCLWCVHAGKWQWELHQRHQYLLRQYQQQGRDTAPLDAAAAAIVAATVQQREQLRDADNNILEKTCMPNSESTHSGQHLLHLQV
jgi:hypothetical protein